MGRCREKGESGEGAEMVELSPEAVGAGRVGVAI